MSIINFIKIFGNYKEKHKSKLDQLWKIFFILLIFNQLNIIATAQGKLCSGTLGDPIIFKDFGSGTAQYSFATPGSFGFSNTYIQKFPGEKTDDGMFSFQNSLNDDFGKIWHDGAQDHTPGDVGGYMLVVNSDYRPGEFYRDTVSNLCIGKTYEFSVFLANVFLPTAPFSIRPNVKFEIRDLGGNLLAFYSTGPILPTTNIDWQKYGMSFSTPNTSVVLLMISDAPGGYGNDIVIDDISFRPCNPVSITPYAGVCENSSTNIKVRVQGSADYRYYQWQTSIDKGLKWKNLDTTYTQTANLLDYTVSLPLNNIPKTQDSLLVRLAVGVSKAAAIDSNSVCRTLSSPTLIRVLPNPELVIKPIAPVCDTDTINLTDTTLFAGSKLYKSKFTFYPTSSDALAETNGIDSLKARKISKSGTYYIKVSTQTSPTCTDTKSVNVVIHPSPKLSVSNPIAVCEPTTLDVTAANVTASSTLYGAGLTYYKTRQNAIKEQNPVLGSAVNAIQKSDTIFIKAKTTTNPSCFDMDSVITKVHSKPVLVVKNPAPVCSPLLVSILDTNLFTGSKRFGSKQTYFLSQTDADGNTNAVPLTILKSVDSSKTYFVKLETPTIPACSDIKPIDVTIHRTPILKISQPLPFCIPGKVEDITNPSITNGSDLFGGALGYFNTKTEAKKNINTIDPNNLKSIARNDTFFIKSTTSTLPQCSDIDSVVVQVNEVPLIKITDPLPVCTPAKTDITKPSIFLGSNFYSSPLEYYKTVADAISGTKKLPLDSLKRVTSSNVYTVKVVHPGSISCSQTADIKVIINISPKAAFVLGPKFCLNVPVSVLLTGSPSGGLFGGKGISGNNFSPSELGTYNISYKVTDAYNCKDSISKPVTVFPNPKVDFTGLNSTYCTFDSTVRLSGTPRGGVFSGSIFLKDSLLTIKAGGSFGIKYKYTDKNGCKDSITKPISVTQSEYKEVSIPDTLICEGSAFIKNAPVTASSYLWEPTRITSPTLLYTPTQSMTYIFYGNAPGICKIYKAVFNVTVIPTPPLPLGGPIDQCLETNPLELVPVWGEKFLWSDGSTGKTLKVKEYGTYSLIAYDKYGCHNQNSLEVSDVCPPKFFVPNAFSPNGDNENDVMGIYGKNFKNMKLMVFNRWGEVIYVTSDRYKPWDGSYRGSEMPIGVYNWQATYESTNEKDKQVRKEEGSVTLIR